jgi:hypothetical protein
MEAMSGLHSSKPDKVPKVELVPGPMEPVVAGFINTRDDVADGRVGARVKASQGLTAFEHHTSHTRNRAFAIGSAVDEIAAKIVLKHGWRGGGMR